VRDAHARLEAQRAAVDADRLGLQARGQRARRPAERVREQRAAPYQRVVVRDEVRDAGSAGIDERARQRRQVLVA
jgi:hypothetical protein